MNRTAPTMQIGPFEVHRSILDASPMSRALGEPPMHWRTPAEFYGGRARFGGLQISEMVAVSRQGLGLKGGAGIYAAEQIAQWREAVSAVHEAGGVFFLRLGHVGRLTHSTINADGPVAPSPIPPDHAVRDADWQLVPPEIPRALSADDVEAVVSDFANSARNARLAGFDAVEIDASECFLVDQFLREGSNVRSDCYGGAPSSRAGFLFDILRSVLDVWGYERVGVRVSPFGDRSGAEAAQHARQSADLAAALYEREIAFLDVNFTPAPTDLAGSLEIMRAIRDTFPGPIIASGVHDCDKATTSMFGGLVDVCASTGL